MPRYTAVLDACVLVPVALADTLLRVAEKGLYRPLWSERILGEAQAAIEEIHPGIDTAKRFASMRESLDDALVTGWEEGVPGIRLPDVDDRHVVAAAVQGGAQGIITANVKDFPVAALKPLGLEAVHPDDFLLAEFAVLLDDLDLDQSPPAQALTRLLDVGWQVAARYPFLWLQPAVDPDKDAERHAPVLDRMLDIIRHGQVSGDFDASVPAHWLLSASLALGRATEDEVKAGRMTIEQATQAMHRSLLRLLGAAPGPGAGTEITKDSEDNQADRGEDGGPGHAEGGVPPG